MPKKKPPETPEELAGELLSGLFGMAGVKIDRAVFVNALGKNVRVRAAEVSGEIPPPKPAEKPRVQQFNWRVVLGFEGTPTVDQVKDRYRQLSKIYHKDAGGSDESMRILNIARDTALRELGNWKLKGGDAT